MALRNVNISTVQDKTESACYQAMRAAVLKTLPSDGEGLTFGELCARIASDLDSNLFPTRQSVRWYAKAVQIDLETGWKIERLPTSDPVRLRRRLEHTSTGASMQLPSLRLSPRGG